MIQKKVTDFFALEGNYPDLDGEGAAARLSAAIRCKTINYFDHSRTDYTEFDKLHAHIKASYPNIMRVGTFERIGHHAVLITIPGSDASLRPCLYMSHQDVVPVVEGTEQDWTHPAFSGDIADGYIWGRGTLDIKEQVFGVLEAAEYLLARGKSFARTAYLAFGDDEETINLGALAIAEHLKAQGVTLEFVLDEGGCKIEPGTAFGAPETFIVSVQLMEKGYADLELSVHSIGGHSSRPYGGTSLGRLSGAIADITRAPFAVRLNSAMTGAFETLAPYITQEPLKTLVQDVAGNADAIAACCMGSPDLFPFVTTTIAPTMIRGGSAACNVMPQDMTAVINFRIADRDSEDEILVLTTSEPDEFAKCRYTLEARKYNGTVLFTKEVTPYYTGWDTFFLCYGEDENGVWGADVLCYQTHEDGGVGSCSYDLISYAGGRERYLDGNTITFVLEADGAAPVPDIDRATQAEFVRFREGVASLLEGSSYLLFCSGPAEDPDTQQAVENILAGLDALEARLYSNAG